MEWEAHGSETQEGGGAWVLERKFILGIGLLGWQGFFFFFFFEG